MDGDSLTLVDVQFDGGVVLARKRCLIVLNVQNRPGHPALGAGFHGDAPPVVGVLVVGHDHAHPVSLTEPDGEFVRGTMG